jgi:predicted RNA-binding Zn ribbon-like protein
LDSHRAHATSDTAPADFVFDLDAGIVCLDFVNTRSATSGDHLNVFAALIAFARQSHLLTQFEADRLHAQAASSPAQAETTLERARRLRRALFRIFSTVAADGQPSPADLDVLNEEIGASLSHASVRVTDDGAFDWTWSGDGIDRVLWPITRSAADLLTSDTERPKVRECGAGDCRWLFLDTSKNRSRQWCSMQSCGNREKARRHYQRLKARRAGSHAS